MRKESMLDKADLVTAEVKFLFAYIFSDKDERG